jgi:transposase
VYHYGVQADTFRRYYKKKLSDYSTWDQKSHAQEYLLFKDNLSENLAIDEVALSKGELYTLLSSRDTTTRTRRLISTVAGTKAEELIEVFLKLPIQRRLAVKEVTLDMSNSMSKAVGHCFPNARQVTDRFHVVRLVTEALQQVRIDQRWKEIEADNRAYEKSRKQGRKHKPVVLENGDTLKQLLARSRYLLYKLPHQWTIHQQHRAVLLFTRYPKIKRAYDLALDFRTIYNQNNILSARKKLTEWIQTAVDTTMDAFRAVAESLRHNQDTILNFFNKRSTNAHAESFNAQIKLFRSNLRGVTNPTFFLYRLQKIFA